jgi:hypothetical protein
MLCELINLQDAKWLKIPMQLCPLVHDYFIPERTSRVVQAEYY